MNLAKATQKTARKCLIDALSGERRREPVNLAGRLLN